MPPPWPGVYNSLDVDSLLSLPPPRLWGRGVGKTKMAEPRRAHPCSMTLSGPIIVGNTVEGRGDAGISGGREEAAKAEILKEGS